ncbi:MAG: phosphopantothenate/pantothenate synthetase [Candidatus Thermoplasmatota archaeon]|nr:phosphopantothenate/pantothenate synthetase [Candidatus Thermoplasmatota archaeon]MCL5789290.1 phosphopantothenate/pantothenate synthetase [Candidatus Thermoplasmatota archaeon]
MEIPRNHPRYQSLKKREALLDFYERGIVTVSGLISQGRGEAFDYLIGEKSQAFAIQAEKAAVAKLIHSARPVLSVNGNAAALAGPEIVRFAKKYNLVVEANIFYWSRERIRLIVDYFKGLDLDILGLNQNARIPGLKSNRGRCEREGIFSADTVLIPLEDGDRAEALKRMGKFVISVDLNPLSRTSRFGDISIVDDVQRAFSNFSEFKEKDCENALKSFDNSSNVKKSISMIRKRLSSIKYWPEL